jgi:hypothetical protein
MSERHPVDRAATLAVVGVVVGVVVSLAACAPGSRVAEEPGREIGPDRLASESLFEIESRYPGPVTVWVVGGVRRVRLGTVSIGQALRQPVPGDFIGRGAVVRLVARPVGGSAEVATETFSVEVGDRVSWTVIRPLASSVATLKVGPGGPAEEPPGNEPWQQGRKAELVSSSSRPTRSIAALSSPSASLHRFRTRR